MEDAETVWGSQAGVTAGGLSRELAVRVGVQVAINVVRERTCVVDTTETWGRLPAERRRWRRTGGYATGCNVGYNAGSTIGCTVGCSVIDCGWHC